MTRRTGVGSVAELVLVVWLFAIVLLVVARFARAQAHLSATVYDRSRYEELVRTTAGVLNGELRYAAAEDLDLVAPHQLRLRAVRGGGAVCAAAERTVTARYRGWRSPEPAKDSVLLVGVDGHAEARDLIGVAAAGRCEDGLVLELDRAPSHAPVLALVFEAGIYEFSSAAFRYQRGEGGRQPLTEALLERGAMVRDSFGLAVSLRARTDAVPRLPADSTRLHVPILNQDRGP